MSGSRRFERRTRGSVRRGAGSRTFLTVALLLLAPWLGGCDSGPRGAGTVTVSVEWDQGVEPLGGAVLFLGAPGMGEVNGIDGARVWQHTPPGEEGGMHVVVLHLGEPNALRFTVHMADVAGGIPQTTLYEVVNQANQPRYPPLEGYRIRVY
jgi:hypothetical protein